MVEFEVHIHVMHPLDGGDGLSDFERDAGRVPHAKVLVHRDFHLDDHLVSDVVHAHVTDVRDVRHRHRHTSDFGFELGLGSVQSRPVASQRLAMHTVGVARAAA